MEAISSLFPEYLLVCAVACQQSSRFESTILECFSERCSIKHPCARITAIVTSVLLRCSFTSMEQCPAR